MVGTIGTVMIGYIGEVFIDLICGLHSQLLKYETDYALGTTRRLYLRSRCFLWNWPLGCIHYYQLYW